MKVKNDHRSKFSNLRTFAPIASLVRTLFIGHARATFSSARTDSKTQQNIERMTYALTWCANIFVGCSVTPTFFGRSLPFLTLFIVLKNKKICVWEVLIISHIILKKESNWYMDTGVRDLKVVFLRLILADQEP